MKELEALVEQARDSSLEERVRIYNEGVKALAALVGLPHPALCPQLVPLEKVEGNDYNPNQVAPPEMRLLENSIRKDGLTMPVVVNPQKGSYVVVDGFHRTSVAKGCPDIRESLQGYLPTVALEHDLPNLMASTVRHNMARGTHVVDLSSKLVASLTRHHWTDKKIGEELGMDPDEVLRMKQVTGLAEIFSDREFSQAWE